MVGMSQPSLHHHAETTKHLKDLKKKLDNIKHTLSVKCLNPFQDNHATDLYNIFTGQKAECSAVIYAKDKGIAATRAAESEAS